MFKERRFFAILSCFLIFSVFLSGCSQTDDDKYDLLREYLSSDTYNVKSTSTGATLKLNKKISKKFNKLSIYDLDHYLPKNVTLVYSGEGVDYEDIDPGFNVNYINIVNREQSYGFSSDITFARKGYDEGAVSILMAYDSNEHAMKILDIGSSSIIQQTYLKSRPNYFLRFLKFAVVIVVLFFIYKRLKNTNSPVITKIKTLGSSFVDSIRK